MKSNDIQYSSSIEFGMEGYTGERGSSYRNCSVQLTENYIGCDVRLEHPRPGMSLFISDFFPDEDIVSPYEVGEGSIVVSSIISGHIVDMGMNGAKRFPLDVSNPCDMILSTSPCEGEMVIKGGSPVKSLGIYLDEKLLTDLVEGVHCYEPLLESYSKNDGVSLLGAFPTSPQSQLIASQIVDCPYRDPCRRIFLESKALELIAAMLHKWGCGPKSASVSISRSDIERLYEARRFLFESMDEPPTLKELALKVGLNEFKLKNGFRDIFGCTVYQALRSHRMQSARAMLLDTDMTVGTVAAMVGYTNMSHFISAFRNEYGVTPGSLLSHSRRQLPV